MTWIHRAACRSAGAFLAAGLLALGYVAYAVVDARAYQQKEARRFERETQQAAATAARASATMSARVPAEGESIGEIRIPRLGIKVMIAQGDSEATLRRAVGHLSGTALPGEQGNVVLAAHRDTFFRPLKDVEAGDSITLSTRGGDVEYLVEWTSVVQPTAVQVLEATDGRTLTLVTCFPFYYVGAAPSRFIVRARAWREEH